MKFLSRLLVGLLATVSLAVLAQDKPLKVGVTAGPHAQIFEQVKKILDKEGLKIQIVEFSDYVQPNAALAAGDLDMNSYQHQPYLDDQNKARGYKLVSVAPTLTYPIGLYSSKIKSLAALPAGATVAVPNDPTNGGRALLLLQKQGLLKLKAEAGLKPTPLDITDNPKKLKIKELDAAQLPRTLADVDAAAINTNYAIPAGLNPVKDALALEDLKGPYVNILVVQEKNKDAAWVKQIIKAYHSAEIKKFVEVTFMGAVFPSW
jgi:D-methionine transport system substrate-binding protein